MGFTHLVDEIILLTFIYTALSAALIADEFCIGYALDAYNLILDNNTNGPLFDDSSANGQGALFSSQALLRDLRSIRVILRWRGVLLSTPAF